MVPLDGEDCPYAASKSASTTRSTVLRAVLVCDSIVHVANLRIGTNEIDSWHREILSDPKAISGCRRNTAGSFWANVQRFDSFVARLSRSYPSCATVHVPRPARSILDFARNDKRDLVACATLRRVTVDLIFRRRARR